MTDRELAKAYEPKDVEPRWYAFWEKQGVFDASDDPNDTRPVYVVPMPPPNVTGSLHMGHALTCTLEDVLIRWQRMRGLQRALAAGHRSRGIATQMVVERQLKREGKTRHDLGREEFVERVWQWKAAERRAHRASSSACWAARPTGSAPKFTMDPDMSRAVREAFVRLYEEGLIYRATRLINWCLECRTALSRSRGRERGRRERRALRVRVPGRRRATGELVVATTRPETMLGDTAVAVHPDDPRYKHLHGKKLVAPVRRPRDPDHHRRDPGRPEVRHRRGEGDAGARLQRLRDRQAPRARGDQHPRRSTARSTRTAAQFAGLDRFEARKAVKKALDEKGLARGSEAARAHAAALPALRQRRRADDLDAVVRAR